MLHRRQRDPHTFLISALLVVTRVIGSLTKVHAFSVVPGAHVISTAVLADWIALVVAVGGTGSTCSCCWAACALLAAQL